MAKLTKIVAVLGPDPDPLAFEKPRDQEKIDAFFGPRTDALREVQSATLLPHVLARVSYLDRPARVAWYLHPDEVGRDAEAQRCWNEHAGDFEHLIAEGYRLQLNTASEVTSMELAAAQLEFEANQAVAGKWAM